MSLYLPPELRWLGWIAGSAWPDGDEDKIWAVAAAYKDAAAALRAGIQEIENAKRTAVAAYPEGAGGEKIAAMFDQLLVGDQSQEALAKFMDQVHDAAFDFGTQIEAAKLMTIVSLVALGIEILWAWRFPPTAPIEQAAAEVATQISLRRLERQFQERILAKVLSVFGEKFANLSKNWVLKILEWGAITGALDASVQVGQIAAGHRKNFNWEQFGTSVAAGLGAPFGRSAANWVNKRTTSFLGNKLQNPWVRGGNGMIVGVASSPVFGFFGGLGAAVITGDWAGTLGNPHGWVGGATQSGMVGGLHGRFGGKGLHSNFEVSWKLPGDGSANVKTRLLDASGSVPEGSRNRLGGNGFGDEISVNQRTSTGSSGSRGGYEYLRSEESAHDPSRPTRPASFAGSTHSDGPLTPSLRGLSHSGLGSDSGSASNHSGRSEQDPAVTRSNYGGSHSSGSSVSGPYERLSSNGSESGSRERLLSNGPGSGSHERWSSNGSESGSHERWSSNGSESGSHDRPSSSGSESGSPGKVAGGGPESGSNDRSSGNGSYAGQDAKPSGHESRSAPAGGGGRSETSASSNSTAKSGDSADSNVAQPSRGSSSANPPADGRVSAATGGPGDRSPGGLADGRGGGPARAVPDGDGSAPMQRPSAAQPPKGGIQGPSRGFTPDSNIVAGQSQRGPASVSSVGSGEQRGPASVSSVNSGEARSSANADGAGQQPRRSVDPGSGAVAPRPRSEGDQSPVRGSVPPEKHAGTGGQRGPEGVESGAGRTFDGDGDHPYRARNDQDEVVITSPDGTEHRVDEDRNIFISRPGEDTVLRIGPDRSVDFLPFAGNHTVAQPGARSESAQGTARNGEFSFGRADGTRHTVLGDGSVRTTSPDGSTTVVKRDGSADIRSPWDDRTLIHADGTVVESGTDRPTVITSPDGTKQTIESTNAATVELPDGTAHAVFDVTVVQGGGRSEHPDQTVIHYDLSGPANNAAHDRPDDPGPDRPRKLGTFQMDRPDGTGFESSPKGIKVFDADGTEYARGSRNSVRVTAPNGQTESRPMNEPIELSNGARLERTPEGFRVEHGDGSVSEIGPRGASFTDGDGVVRGTRSNGTAFVKHPDNTVREIRGDAAIRVTTPEQTSWGSRGDGTIWKVDDKNRLHAFAPDGTPAPLQDLDPRSLSGAHLTAKLKPHLLNGDDTPMDPYRAPMAPGPEDWIPQEYIDDRPPPTITIIYEDSPYYDASEGYWGPTYLWGPPGDWPPSDAEQGDGGSSGPGPDDGDQDIPWPEDADRSNRTGGSGHVGGDGDTGGPGDSEDGDSGDRGRTGDRSGSGDRGSGDRGGSDDRAGSGDRAGAGDRGSSGDRRSFGDRSGSGEHGASDDDRRPSPRPEPPAPPQPDPNLLAKMLENLQQTAGMVPPPGSGESFPASGEGDPSTGAQGPGGTSPDFWRLGPGNGLPTSRGGSAGDSRSEESTGASARSRQSPGGGSGFENRLERTKHPDAQTGPGTQVDPRTSGQPDAPGRPGASQHADTQQPDHPGGTKYADGEGNSGSTEPGDQVSADDRVADPGAGSNATDGTSTADRSGVNGASGDSGASGSGDGHSAPLTGNHAEDGQPSGTPSSMPGRMPVSAPPDGHNSAAPTAPAMAPPAPAASRTGTSSGAVAGAKKKKQSRRERKKDDAPRKLPTSVLLPPPDEAREPRAGTGDSTDVPFTLGASIATVEPVIEKRTITETTRSTTDG
ncbi:hypothetical protein AB0M22_22310 [Nocardia sp. NPDC051756]|uniref:WXG100-like domain-containing protein n=1 Tax=Nocardia sp. NPDC051756 TaxID=3154751 RepID=UPI00341A33C0